MLQLINEKDMYKVNYICDVDSHCVLFDTPMPSYYFFFQSPI